jgi:ubiquinone/menaquinone biosynthesis C-methylase UbiE
MTFHEPSSLEVFVTVAIGNLFGRVYKSYVDRLDLQGNERVLDFGSGAGTPARLIARRLRQGGGKLTCVDISRRWIETAQRRLKAYPSVTFKLGEISTLDIPDAAHDIVFVHFVIHDIPPTQRPQVVKHLARKLVPGGQIYVREPLNVIGQDEIRRLMQQHGLEERQAGANQVPLMGETFEGVYVKKERAEAQAAAR